MEALAPNGVKGRYTVSTYPRDNLSRPTRAMLDALSRNPATKDVPVNSGYRSPAGNKKAGGAKRSQHMKGNAIDLGIGGLTPAQKSAVLGAAIAAGAKGIGVYASGNSLHIDPRANPTVWGQLSNAYKGMTKGQFSLLPDWARPHIDALFGGFNPKQNPALPETMTAPRSLADVRAQEAVAQAYRDPMRALDVAPSPVSPSRLTAQYSQYRPALDVARPSAMPGALAPASTFRPDNLNRSLFGRDSFAPAPAPSVASRPSTPTPTGLPSAPSTANLASAYGQYAASRNQAAQTQALANQYSQYRPSTVTSMPTVAGMPSIPAPTGLPAAKPVAAPLAHPVSVPVAPAPVLAPALAPPKTVQDYAVAEAVAPPAAPKATAYDVYNGLADTALDNTGQNTIGTLPGGVTTVTNKYGVTTGMTPYGKQTAVGSLPGITPPSMSKIGGALKGALPGVAGSTVGGLLGGPIGALLGGLVARSVTAPGGLLSNQVSYQTNAFGNINAARPQGGLGFPDAPSGGYKGSASFSNNSRSGMQSMSPKAAADIDAGRGGLF